MLRVYFILLLAIIYSVGCKGSEVASVEVHGYRLTYYDYPPDMNTFAEAIAACEEKGGHLAYVKSSVFNKAILGILQTRAWIGGTDAFDGTWIWLDGTPFEDHYTDWYEGEPNNGQDLEHCLEIGYTYRRQWNDAICSHKKGCQNDLRTSRTASNISIGAIMDTHKNEAYVDNRKESCNGSWLVALLVSGTLVICLLVVFLGIKKMYARYRKQENGDEVQTKGISYKNNSVFAIEVESKNPQSEEM